ncbi:NAD(P)H:quinone oxidoreductase [Candidatus Bathyarchaeota archaeon]|nr:NAD(P)H:quinone oxidoreductase [Candidatus Bathyarchaeota archaeon]
MSDRDLKILIVFYSMYGNTARLARAVAEGVGEVEGVKPVLRQVPELIPQHTIDSNPRIKAVKESLRDIPVANVNDLAEADGVIFGTPTRFGNMCSQMKQSIDQTGSLWLEGRLEGKPAGVFTSTSTLHGGQETTIISTMIPLLHHGMIIVGVPYSESRLLDMDFGGGSPYGASAVVGPESEMHPTERDLAIAKTLGRRVAEVAKKLRN